MDEAPCMLYAIWMGGIGYMLMMMPIKIVQEKHPSVPLFLVGHSMGGMIALRCVIRFLSSSSSSSS